MSNLSTEQMAELLLGIARSQLAMADAVESAKAGFKMTHLRPNVESAARVKMNRPLALADFPSRLLLQMLGRNPPTLDAVTRDLQALLAANTAVQSGASLDMTR
ncbi:MAG: hypothetical protein FJY56_10175 [Betaproteobacteria bacterium]|nr:hypothetical protein [Betaproteobacteria bacterium]